MNPSYKKGAVSTDEAYFSTSTILTGAFYCPVTLLEMNGLHPFSVISPCGCVISDRALKEVKSSVCLRCGAEFAEDNIIRLNPPDDVVEEIRRVMKEKAAASKKEKVGDGSKLRKGEVLDDSGRDAKKAKVETTTSVSAKALLIADEAKKSLAAAKSSNSVRNIYICIYLYTSCVNVRWICEY